MRLVAFAFVASAALTAACSSAGSSGGTLAPDQVNANDPSAVREPTPLPPPDGPSPPPGPPEPMRECPSQRTTVSTLELSSVDDARTRLDGLYRSCEDGMNLELRIDPDSDSRLLWYALDSRFVRLPAGTGRSGTIDIADCDGAVCSITWRSDDGGSARTSDLTVWGDPTAIRATSDYSGAPWVEYLRIAD